MKLTIYVGKMLMGLYSFHFTFDKNILKFGNKGCVLNICVYFSVLFIALKITIILMQKWNFASQFHTASKFNPIS